MTPSEFIHSIIKGKGKLIFLTTMKLTNEQFQHLREAQSLKNLVDKNKQSIREQEERHSSLILKLQNILKNKRADKEELAEVRAQIHTEEKELESLRKQGDYTGNTSKLEHSENIILELLEKEEELLAEISEYEVSEELAEHPLAKEISQIIQSQEAENIELEKRIKSLITLLPDEVHKRAEQAFSKLRPATTFLEKRNCMSCGSQLSTSEAQEVEFTMILKNCPNCSRLLLPQDSLLIKND